MTETPDEVMRSLLYGVVLVLCFRAARLYGFLFLLANFGVLLRATVQIHSGPSGGKPGPPKRRQPKKRGGRLGQEVRNASPIRRPNSASSPRAAPTPTRKTTPPPPLKHSPSPPPYCLDSPKLDAEPRPESILQLYEDIIASDAQTIQVQQDTMSAQQETIRAQAQMIKNMRLLLERQDERIEELERVVEERV